ncbi:DinB family protein [Ulvibacterium sp.]|uniref:DinB family protein n=1 Tax=Ulvibacterium sp. TaxID=2665914 RepID=UPI003BA8C57D
MKKVVLPILVLALFGFGLKSPGLTDTDREMAVKELTRTQKYLKQTVKGLSPEQMEFKPSPETWSIAECVEHLAISENIFHGMLQGALKIPADPSQRDSVKLTDQQLLGIIIDRSKKVKTREEFEPKGTFGSYQETLKAFHSKRKAHIKYVKNTQDDLRNHYGQLPFGTIDGLQIILFMSGHTERHIKQMEEIMAHTDFPNE